MQSVPEQNDLQVLVDFMQNPDFKESRMQMDAKVFIFILFAATNAVEMLSSGGSYNRLVQYWIVETWL